MLEAKDQGHKLKCSPPKKRKKTVFKKKGLQKIFQAFSRKKRLLKLFLGDLQNFNNSKNFNNFRGLEASIQGLDLRGQGQGLQNVSSRTPALAITDVQFRGHKTRGLGHKKIRGLGQGQPSRG